MKRSVFTKNIPRVIEQNLKNVITTTKATFLLFLLYIILLN